MLIIDSILKIPSEFKVQDERIESLKFKRNFSVLVIGNIAVGKSYFSKQFAEINNLQLIELDDLRSDVKIDSANPELIFMQSIGRDSSVCSYVGMGLGKEGLEANKKADLIIRIHASIDTSLKRIKNRNNQTSINGVKIDRELLHYISSTLDERGFSIDSIMWNGTTIIHIINED